MSEYFVLLIVIILGLAALLQEDFVLTLLYFVIAAYAVSRWWSGRALNRVKVQRSFNNRAFINDKVTIRIDIHNPGWLPVVWLRMHDSLPVDLVGAEVFRRVIGLGPHASQNFEYVIQPPRRGYYQVGPLYLYSGDLLGMSEDEGRQGQIDHLIVYPRILPLSKPGLPSRSPMGTLRHHQPIFEDPSRVRGKRDYVAGDSLRRVDWKSSANLGRLQVKQFEPSIALETIILLNLDREDYYYRSRHDATELGIVVTASLAAWITTQKQTVGFATNGADVLDAESRAPVLSPEKGRGQLMRILDVLARIQTTEKQTPFIQLVRRQRVHQAWGTTLILVTGDVNDEMFDELFSARRAGLNIVLFLCGHVIAADAIKHKAEHFGIQIHQFANETELDQWRR